jgi:hypothetical protein
MSSPLDLSVTGADKEVMGYYCGSRKIQQVDISTSGLLFPPPPQQQAAGMVPAREPYKDMYSITYKNNEIVFKTYV